MIIGIFFVSELARSLLAKVMPSIPGNIQSKTIKSGNVFLTRLSAISALIALSGLKPD